MIRQIGWSSFRRGIAWSTHPSPVYRRFSITQSAHGYTVADHQTHRIERTTTLAAARAWAGVQVGERCVRHE